MAVRLFSKKSVIIFEKNLDKSGLYSYNNEAVLIGPESDLDLAGCVGGRENRCLKFALRKANLLKML